MTNPTIYLKAFAAALSDHLRGVKHDYTELKYGGGGCETCGYGASEYDVLDMEALTAEIDKFADTFKPEKS
jgi:hypothetical protein